VSSEYYVYCCSVDGMIRYIGKGKGGRLNHCNSGKSSCYELNKAHFDGKDIEVWKHTENLTKSEADRLEAKLIQEFKDQLFNIQQPKTDRLRFHDYLESFYKNMKSHKQIHITEFKKLWRVFYDQYEACNNFRFPWYAYPSSLKDYSYLVKYLGWEYKRLDGKQYFVKVQDKMCFDDWMKECFEEMKRR